VLICDRGGETRFRAISISVSPGQSQNSPLGDPGELCSHFRLEGRELIAEQVGAQNDVE
jgi:hypothetical protein